MAEVEAARTAARVRFAHLAEDDGGDEVGHVSGLVDPDNPPMTDEELARLRPAAETASALVVASLRRRGGQSRPPAPMTPALPGVEQPTRTAMGDVVQVVEERLNVGKRAVSRGKVRVRTIIVSREVSENIALHAETVSIDRRAVDRPVSASGLDVNLFQERTIELEEFAEEAVVAKSAHVVEEISIHKAAADRVETVREMVRRTVVDIEDERTGRAAAGDVRRPTPEIRAGMEVFGSDGVLVGSVDSVDGGRLGVRFTGAAITGQHHYLPWSIVDSVVDRVTLAVTADEAGARSAMA